ncbi:hypothetical protein [Rosistilla oblonga]|uniref:HEAT repeat protein n=1 Tax=Rosistilla oblonga TaxID=2527990 RepID=A0A518IQ11_9BACT|nr:hypothetical protein [Rosistilla oblonga]QDV55160.1 hypothetical protein Mal33_11290 [Rosistilla oblonga]
MPERKSVTAAELMAELEADPEWVARREAKERESEEHRKVCAADQLGLVREIRDAGYDVDSVWDLVNNSPHPVLERRFLGEYPDAYPILVQHLSVPHRKEIREGLIRALTVKDGGPEVESTLLECFYAETDEKMRWVIANALRTAMPYHRRKKHPEIKAALNP